MNLLNETHNSARVSWLVTANKADTDFPIQNLPFAVFKRANSEEAFRGGVAIGDQVIDLAALANANVFDGLAQAGVKACNAPQLNDYMAMGKATWSALRLALSDALKEGSALQDKVAACLIAQADVEYALPCNIGDYT
ncbi:fumarylacetoacetase, partial [Colwellia sp. BRX8-8]|nr:fumarylacetoacetase [Colwellia sp. BRX8-8]